MLLICSLLFCFQEGVEEGTVVVLVGNKTDLSDEDDHRVVKYKDGSNMAKVSLQSLTTHHSLSQHSLGALILMAPFL